jgi:uncharacterized protein (TIGR04255 family)
LVLVLVQARFPKRTDFAERIGSFRTACEPLDYPLFHEGQIQTFGIGPSGAPFASIPRWDILDRSRRWNIVVSPEFLLLQTTRYDRFGNFLDRWKSVLEAAADALGIPLVERLGLRYVDLVQPAPSEKVKDYVDSSLAGYEPDAGSGFRRERHMAATVLRTDRGQMLVRVSPATTSVPPDFDSIHLEGLREPTPGAVFLDFDHSSTEVLDFDVEKVVSETKLLHDAHHILFESTITPQAKVAWGWEKEP